MATFEHLSTSNIIPAGSRPSGATENHIFGDATINDIPMNNGDVNGTPKRSVSSIFDTSGNDPPVRPARRQFSNRNQPSELWFNFEDDDDEDRGDTTAIQKEREERVRRLREQQEDERRKKLEELRQHALAAQKFREQQEYERRRHLEELRYRDEDKRSQVEERRRAIEAVERERREALLKKNQEREERLEIKRRQQGSQINFAFGSSTPRILGSRVDSTNEVWKGTMRSNSTSNVTNQLMTQSLYSRRSSERDQIDFTTTPNPKKTKRAISAQGLNKSGEGEENLMSQSMHLAPSYSAHRKRHPDLMPTITASANSNVGSRTPSRATGDHSRSSTPGHKMIRSATTVSSLDGRGNRNVDDDSISNSSKTSSTQNKPRRTPAQVKAHSKAKKSPVTGTPTKTPTTPVKSPKVEAQPVLEPDLNNVSETNETQAVSANSEAAPDVISNTTAVKDNEEDKPEEPKEVATLDDDGNNNRNDDQQSQGVGVKSSPEPEKSILPDNDIDSEPAGSKKNIITTEDEAKARFAEKRREAKEIERQKLLAIQREEEERRLREEEEARLLQEEADRIAQEARRIEDERLQRAIEKNEQREREQKEREERFRREKEEAAKRAKEEEEKKRIEREEKLRKEEEERNERKRRIAEIRARTGLGKTSTVTPPKVTENNTEAKESNSDANVANTDRSNGNEQLMDPIKPDLLGDIADKTIKIPTSDIEKGLLDMQISAKDENEKNKQINSSKFDSLNFKHPDEKSMLGDNDRDDTEQIIDFSVNSSTNGHDVEVENRTSPISAFGENHVEISPADLLS